MKLTVYRYNPEERTLFTDSEIEEWSNVRNKYKSVSIFVSRERNY
jgi:hypothetical protein